MYRFIVLITMYNQWSIYHTKSFIEKKYWRCLLIEEWRRTKKKIKFERASVWLKKMIFFFSLEFTNKIINRNGWQLLQIKIPNTFAYHPCKCLHLADRCTLQLQHFILSMCHIYMVYIQSIIQAFGTSCSKGCPVKLEISIFPSECIASWVLEALFTFHSIRIKAIFWVLGT